MVPGVEPDWMLAGSVRRGKETIGDVDVLVTGADTETVIERFIKLPRMNEVLGRGPNKVSARVGQEQIQVDVRVLPARIATARACNTSPAAKSTVWPCATARCNAGFSLSEYGLFLVNTEQRVAGETEAEVYDKLGLAYIPPELRENRGEIEAAANGKLPKLVEQRDLRGDLHMHTRASDGRATIEEMALAAKEWATSMSRSPITRSP